MKFLISILITAFTSLSIAAPPHHLFAMCYDPNLESGTEPSLNDVLQVWLSNKDETAFLFTFGSKRHKIHAYQIGPISHFDFNTPSGEARLILSVDGRYELQAKNAKGIFKRTAKLKCDPLDFRK